VLATHSRGRDVRGRLVELDPGLAAAAREVALDGTRRLFTFEPGSP
jgi:hypothetical protein